MKKICFITPSDAEYGFSLSGVDQRVTGEADAKKVLSEVLGDPETGLVVIDERLSAAIDPDPANEIEKNWQGILLTLPAPEKKEGVEDYAARLIKRAIGYHVRLGS